MVNVIITSDSRYNINRSAIQTTVLSVLASHHIKGKVEVEVSIVGDRKMHELNQSYRGISATTDVLSFALEDPMPQNFRIILTSQDIEQSRGKMGLRGFVAAPDGWLRLGSIVISYPEAVQDAVLDKISIEEEINFLVEHGANHLLGIHHD